MPKSKSDQPIALDRAYIGSRYTEAEAKAVWLPSTARTLFSSLRVSTQGKQAGPLVSVYHSAGRQPANSTPRPAVGCCVLEKRGLNDKLKHRR